jgi:hypothetical protein
MTKLPIAALAAVLLLGACGGFSQSNWNPFNWFGNSSEVEAAAAAQAQQGVPSDPRPLVAQVLSLAIEPYSGGAIVRATGLPPTQGFYDGELVEESFEDGRLTYRFVLIPPPEPNRVSTQVSREVTVGTSISRRRLEEIREVVVRGQQNARSSRR